MLDRTPRRWHRQESHGHGFPAISHPLTDLCVLGHLSGEYWLATRVPSDRTRWIGVDLDTEDGADDPFERPRGLYHQVRELLGDARPIVWETPSGGLRAYWRIPETELAPLVGGLRRGRLPEALLAAGIPVEKGILEPFPRPDACDRLPLGERMAILDPDTLRPLMARAPRGDREEWLRRGLELLEQWDRDEQPDVLSDLVKLPTKSIPGSSILRNDEPGSELIPLDTMGRPSPALQRLIEMGLERPNSRYEMEWIIGCAMWRWPSLFPELRGVSSLSKDALARALAEWLVRLHNGYSKEIAQDLARSTEEATVREWTRKFLSPTPSTGFAPVDRMRRQAISRLTASLDPWPVEAEMDHVLTLGRRLRSLRKISPKHRYWFEVWSLWALAQARFFAAFQGCEPQSGFTEIRIASSVLRRAPGGQVRVQGSRGYRTWGYYLAAHGLLVPVGEYRRPTEKEAGAVRLYRIPDLASFPPCPKRGIEKASDDSGIHSYGGRRVSMVERLHAVTVRGSDEDIERAYGKAHARRIRELANRVVPRFAA